MFGYFDWTFLIIIPALLFALYAQFRVKSSFNKYQKHFSSQGHTAREVARMILDENGLFNVKIEHISGELTDHFDPKTNIVRLSDAVDNSTSIAAIGIAAHEVGHAIQHAEGYMPVKIRTALVPVTNIGSKISMYLIFAGLILAGSAKSSEFGFTLAIIGLLAYCLVAVFQFVTLPVEFNASSRALNTLEQNNYLNFEEVSGAKKVLNAAAMTYVAALVSTLLTILRLFLIITQRNRRRR